MPATRHVHAWKGPQMQIMHGITLASVSCTEYAGKFKRLGSQSKPIQISKSWEAQHTLTTCKLHV
jgi:hypothetical protein